MIIVEGPDGAGKTTLIKYLHERTHFPVAPRVVSKDTEAMTDLVQWVEENTAHGFQNMIFDRHRLISEPIYGSIIRSEFQPKFDNPQWLVRMLSRLYRTNPIIIYCMPPLGVVWGNVSNDIDNRFITGKGEGVFRAIWGAYFNRATSEIAMRHHSHLYDYTSDFAPENRRIILASIRARLQENSHARRV